MYGMEVIEMFKLVVFCMIGIISFVGIATGLISFCNKKSRKSPKIFLGELDNTDCPIELVVRNLRLTNGIENNSAYHNTIMQRMGKYNE